MNLMRLKDVETLIERKEVLRKYRESGLNAREFSKRHGLGKSTLYRYLEKETKGDLLDGRAKNHGQMVKINNEVTAWILQFHAQNPKAGVAALHRALEAKAKEENWSPVPSYWWIIRFLATLPLDVKTALIEGSRASVEKASLSIPRVVREPNALWQIDFTEAPVWAFDPSRIKSQKDDSEGFFKPNVIGIIDCASRNVMNLLALDRHPTTADLLYAVRQAIRCKTDPRHYTYGKPRAINSDNHQVFHPKGDWGQSLLLAGIEPQYSPDQCPEANGKCERFFLTASQRIFSSLSSFADKHSALAQARKHCIPWVLFQRYLDAAVYESYHLVDHSELGKSPHEAWNHLLDNAFGLVYNVPAVDMALRVTKELEVSPKGVEVTHLRHYTHACLEGRVGSKILVRIPPSPEPLPPVLPAYSTSGEHIGDITCSVDDSLAETIRQSRLERTIAIKGLRKTLIEGAQNNPLANDPSSPPTRSPHNYESSPGENNADCEGDSIGPIPKIEPVD